MLQGDRLSGSVIVSNYPINVWSGEDDGYTQKTIEQIIPVNRWSIGSHIYVIKSPQNPDGPPYTLGEPVTGCTGANLLKKGLFNFIFW